MQLDESNHNGQRTMSSEFYRAFEDKFRGKRENIKERLKVYLPFIQTLKGIYSDTQVTDLGCGRGEWLELMGENDFSAHGVDLDEGMLTACRELNLDTTQEDVIAYLKKLPNESQLVISGFHIVEHIPFDDLHILVKESLRALKPAGLLILETPNPENIVVGTSSFYLDPTHNKPIPPDLLAFLPDYYGFEKVKILRLQESLNLADKEKLSLLNVFNGVSPDYAVVAQKNAEQSLLKLTRKEFEIDYGITLEQLTTTFSEQNDQTKEDSKWLQNELKNTRNRIEEFVSECATARSNEKQLNALLNEKKNALLGSEATLIEQSTKAHTLQIELTKAELKVAELNQSKHHWHVTANQLDEELKAVYASKSWQIILRLRQLMHLVFGLFRYLNQLFVGVTIAAMRFVITHPRLRDVAFKAIAKFPRLYAYLNTMALQGGLSTKTTQYNKVINDTALSPNALRIYTELKQAIEKRGINANCY